MRRLLGGPELPLPPSFPFLSMDMEAAVAAVSELVDEAIGVIAAKDATRMGSRLASDRLAVLSTPGASWWSVPPSGCVKKLIACCSARTRRRVHQA